jgi:hypothetical protein
MLLPCPIGGGGVPLLQEEAAQVLIVGVGVEAQVAHILQVLEHARHRGAQLGQRGARLGLTDPQVLLLARRRTHALPRQPPPMQEDEQVANALKVVTPGLCEAAVRIHAGVASSARPPLVLAHGDVPVGRVEGPRQAKVDEHQRIEGGGPPLAQRGLPRLVWPWR